MVQHNSLLVMLVQLVDFIPMPPTPQKRGRGRPIFYPDRLFLKALVIMILKHLHSPYEFFCVLLQPTPEMEVLRHLLSEEGRFPSRRTWERRLKAIPAKLPAQISCLGSHLVELINPWASVGEQWLPTVRYFMLKVGCGITSTGNWEKYLILPLIRRQGGLNRVGTAGCGVGNCTLSR